MFCRNTARCAAALTLILTAGLLHAAQPYEVTIERAVSAKMRDGVTAAALRIQ